MNVTSHSEDIKSKEGAILTVLEKTTQAVALGSTISGKTRLRDRGKGAPTPLNGDLNAGEH